MDLIEIATLGDSTDFGDLTYGRAVIKDVGCSSELVLYLVVDILLELVIVMQ